MLEHPPISASATLGTAIATLSDRIAAVLERPLNGSEPPTRVP